MTNLNDLNDDQIVELLKTTEGKAARNVLLKELGERLAAEITAKQEEREARRAKHAAAIEAAKRAKRLARDPHRKARETFKRIVRELGTTFEVTGDGYVEVAPWEGYPLGFTTLHYDWTESHERFEYALADPSVLSEDGYYTG